ncbi:MAG: transposase [bacterium]|nr:transposase [bacterium]
MANRRIEMYEYRQVLHRMRCGDSNREIARSRLMGRRKARQVRRIAQHEGWLEPSASLPAEAALAEYFHRDKPGESSVSLVEPHREEVTKWFGEGIDGTTICAALRRKHGFQGSYSSVRRFLKGLRRPSATVVLDFSPGETAQVDFGQGPRLIEHGEEVSTWVFVMTLCWSRHQYAELVLDQKVSTWLGCHRRAFEFFGGVPQRLTIDYVSRHIIDLMFPPPLCG